MRIMIIEREPDYGGGSEQMSLSLAQYLKSRGHTLFLLHQQAGTMLPAYEQIIAGRVQFPLPGFARRRPIDTSVGIARMGRAIRDNRIDVAVTSYFGFIPVAAWVSALYGARFCFHLGLPCFWTTLFSRMAYQRIAAGVAPSEHCAQTWREGGWPAERIHVIPNWIDMARFTTPLCVEKVRQEIDLPQDRALIVFVGRICADKGVKELLAAFDALAQLRGDTDLVIVGPVDADYKAEFARILGAMSPALRARILIRPPTATPERYFAAATVVCVPSVSEEPFGLTFIEALATGVPVVASRMKTFSEIVGDELQHGLVATGDVDALRNQLLWTLDNLAIAHAGAARLQERVRTRFTADVCASQYEALFDNLVAGRRGDGDAISGRSAIGPLPG